MTPTSVWRQGDRVYWHGSSASRMLRATQDDVPVCVTVTLLDALVLARSGFDHSIDYRSVMILGTAHAVEDPEERLESLRIFTERLYPGRWDELRPATRQELKATTVLWTTISEASAKLRTDGPHDEPGDETWPAWAGLIPVETRLGAPEPDGVRARRHAAYRGSRLGCSPADGGPSRDRVHPAQHLRPRPRTWHPC